MKLKKLYLGNLLKDLIQHMQTKIDCLHFSEDITGNNTQCNWYNNLKYFAYSVVNINKFFY